MQLNNRGTRRHPFAMPLSIVVALAVMLPWQASHAYVGPGLGLGAIAAVLGVIGSVFLALFAVVWYPIKRLLKQRKAAQETTAAASESDQD